METKDILKKLRKSKGYANARDFCEAVEISYNTYQNYETGKRVPPADVLVKLADFYGVTTDYLLGRELQSNPLANVKTVDDDEFIRLYSSLPDYAKQIFVDTMAKLAKAQEKPKIKKIPAPRVEQDSETAEEIAPNTGKKRHSMRTGDLVTDDEAKAKEAT